MKFNEKLVKADPASFHVLDEEKARRMKARTLYIPSIEDVYEVISAIPKRETRTIMELRSQLARKGEADIACPAKTIGYWKWLAFASEHEGYAKLSWWRVLKDGKFSNLLPGGMEAHRSRVDSEQK